MIHPNRPNFHMQGAKANSAFIAISGPASDLAVQSPNWRPFFLQSDSGDDDAASDADDYVIGKAALLDCGDGRLVVYMRRQQIYGRRVSLMVQRNLCMAVVRRAVRAFTSILI